MSKIMLDLINKDIKMYMVLCLSAADGLYYPAIGSNGLPLMSFNASTLGTVVTSRKNETVWVPNITKKMNWRGKIVECDNGEYVDRYSDVVIVEYACDPINIIK